MIERAEIVPLLTAACPTFLTDTSPAGDDVAEQLGRFAHHLVDLAVAGDASEFPAVFDVVDRLLVEGDAVTVAAVRTNLIEDLQNITSHRDVPVASDAFFSVLGPAATEVWLQLDEAWSAAADSGGSGARIPAEEYLVLGETDRRRVQSMTRELPDGTLARPSDVLRYEADRYDEALANFRQFLRGSMVWFVIAAVFALVLIWLFA